MNNTNRTALFAAAPATLADLKVGDSAVLCSQNSSRDRTTQVVKVGRKFLYVASYREGFDRTTGRMTEDSNAWLVTEEEHACLQEAKQCRKELDKHGVTFSYSVKPEQIIAARAALLTVFPRS